jgi:hypothetical protein
MMSSQMSFPGLTGPRLVVIAAVLHVSLALALFVAGRAGVAPGLIDRDGIMGSFAFDSYDYQRGAIETSQLLRNGNLRAWASAAQPLHVKLIAVPFALLHPVFGYSPLSAEPYNVVCYVAIVCLVFALGSELGGRRAGILSAVLVALWPTFLLHTLQLLKDSIFITAALAFLWCAITLLIRTYQPAASAGVSVLALLLLLLLAFVRGSSVLLFVAVAALVLGLLIVRQTRERRLLFWNMTPAIAVLLTGLFLLPFISGQSITRTKTYPSDQAGPLKNVADPSKQVPTLVRWINTRDSSHGSTNGRSIVGGRLARRISSMRSRFAASYADAGSLLDAKTEFRNAGDLLRYIPRALEIGMWAPFPSTWFFSGRRVGNVGKIVSGFETLAIYLLQALTALALIREPQRLGRWFLVGLIVCGVTALAFVIPNAGAIYRFRYVFWILLIIAAMTGPTFSKQREWRGLKQVMITVAIAVTLAAAHGCSSRASVVKPQNSMLALTNFTGTAFSSLYLSPSSAPDWQENLLVSTRHNDGDTLDIQFDPNESNVEWDLRVQGIDGHYAEWKNLKFDGVTEITLVLKLSPTPVVVAEVE